MPELAEQPVADEEMPLVDRPPGGGERRADQRQLAPSSPSSASATGPMLPSGVESKVEQYLNAICAAPFALSQRQAASDCATASAAGTERVLSAITAASMPGSGAPSGTPAYCSVRAPARASVLAASLEPVKSSPITPICICRRRQPRRSQR